MVSLLVLSLDMLDRGQLVECEFAFIAMGQLVLMLLNVKLPEESKLLSECASFVRSTQRHGGHHIRRNTSHGSTSIWYFSVCIVIPFFFFNATCQKPRRYCRKPEGRKKRPNPQTPNAAASSQTETIASSSQPIRFTPPPKGHFAWQ